MGWHGPGLVALVMLVTCVSCSPDADVAVSLDVELGGVTAADVFQPRAGNDGLAPVVVMLHGTAAERSRLHGLAQRVAAEGVLVYVPSWPVIDQAQGYPADTDEPYRRQAETVVCALRHIRRTAMERGGDPDELTVFGHSGGAMVGAQVAMVSEPPWPGIDCDAGTSHAPQRFIGSAGDYNGLYQLSEVAPPGSFAPYDPTVIEPTNTDLEVRLVHGLSDATLGASESSEFVAHVGDHGLDAELITTDSGHGDMIDPTTTAGRFVAEQVVALVYEQPSAFDLEGEAARISYDGVCNYEGPSTFEVGRPIDLEFETSEDPQLRFLAFSILAEATVSDEEILSYEGVPLAEPPEFVDTGGLQLVDRPGSETFRLVFLESDQRWVLACVPVEPRELETPEVPRLAVVLSPVD